MSLFDHIKKKPDSTETANTDEQSANTSTTDSAVTVNTNQGYFANSGSYQTEQTPTTQPHTYTESIQTETVKELTPITTDVRHYSVGIDLGTTHCVLSYVDITDIDEGEYVQQVLAIPQLSSPGVVEESYQLPSFLYQAHDSELSLIHI